MDLTGLSSLCGNNKPGIFNLDYAPTSYFDKAAWKSAKQDPFTFSDAWPFVSGKAYLRAPVIIGRNSYNETESDGDSGKITECNLSVFLPYDSEAINTELSHMTHMFFILQWQDFAGKLWTLGTLDHPCSFSKSFDNGTKMGTSKGYSMSFSCQTPFQRRRRLSPIS